MGVGSSWLGWGWIGSGTADGRKNISKKKRNISISIASLHWEYRCRVAAKCNANFMCFFVFVFSFVYWICGYGNIDYHRLGWVRMDRIPVYTVLCRYSNWGMFL